MRHNDPARGRDRGFSLIELMITMVVTLVVTGAIYGLLTGGQNAFRREPELSDRQQNVRIAMAMVNQDASRAGLNLPAFVQAFTDGLNGTGPTGPDGTATDEIEILAVDECQQLDVCGAPGTNVFTWERLPQCFALPALVALSDNGNNAGIYWGEQPANPPPSPCSSGPGANGLVNFPHGQSRFANPAGGPGFNPTRIARISVVRYRIQVEPDGTPNLWRSAYGGVDVNGQSSWQMVARGIENLQVTYRNAAGWQDTPGSTTCPTTPCAAVTPTDYDRIIRQVRVVVAARAMAANLQGESTSVSGGRAVRGQLQEDISPRAALIALTGRGTVPWY
jgi:prepilin-type N-terminal cleavage/methylation domain-containing protein